jgi:UDP-N-acetylglucosamine 2-epimerase (non-hydrolysing)
MLLALEPILRQTRPDLVVVVGDVTSTLAAALAAAQLQIPVAHVEAGLRSGNNRMPEELNRRLTDAVSAHLFATEQAAVDNLLREGIPEDRIHLVGNVMIDALLTHLREAENLRLVEQTGLTPGSYALLTLHRPANVDNSDALRQALEIVRRTAERLPLVFPVHPRTRQRLQTFGLEEELQSIPNVHLLPPQGYLEFLHWMMNARIVLTDSGGVQEETTFLQIPCLTLRDETERPCTVELGTNTLLPGLNPELVTQTLNLVLHAKDLPKRIPPLWDGGAAPRIAAILQNLVDEKPN